MNAPYGRASLHIICREVQGPDTLVGNIDAELDRVEQVWPMAACQVILTRSGRSGYQATVALEQRGGRCISSSASGGELMDAVHEAFARGFAQSFPQA